MKPCDEYYPEKLLKLYFKHRLDDEIEEYRYKWKEKYGEEYYDTMKGLDYDKLFVQQNKDVDIVASRAVTIADLRLYAERRYKYLSKAKDALNRLLDSLNGKQKNMLDFYFEYEGEVKAKCVEIAEEYKQGRKDYREVKQNLRYCCNELDKMLL